MVVPSPGALSMYAVPPSDVARSLIPASPRPRGPPGPRRHQSTGGVRDAEDGRPGQDRDSSGVEAVAIHVTGRGGNQQHDQYREQPAVEADGGSQDAVHPRGIVSDVRGGAHGLLIVRRTPVSRINRSATEGWPFHRRAAAAAPPDWTRPRPLFEEITMIRPHSPHSHGRCPHHAPLRIVTRPAR